MKKPLFALSLLATFAAGTAALADEELIVVRSNGALERHTTGYTYTPASWWYHTPAAWSASVGAARAGGSGWGDVTALKADNKGDLYAVQPDGQLRHYAQPLTRMGNEAQLQPGDLTAIGTGWSPTRLGEGLDGTLFLESGGNLLWYRYADGWQPGTGSQAGSGWSGFTSLFGHNQALFGIAANGALWKYTFQVDQSHNFTGFDSSAQVGVGWDVFAHVATGFDGVIYGLTASGDLYWYKIDLATNTWNEFSGRVIATGWSDVTLLAVGRNQSCTHSAYQAAYDEQVWWGVIHHPAVPEHWDCTNAPGQSFTVYQ